MKRLPNLDFVFGLVLLIAAISKFADPFLYHRLQASTLFLVGLALDVTFGALLIANCRSGRIRGASLLVFVGYLGFIVTSILTDHWTCNCFGGTRHLYIPLTIDCLAVIYFVSTFSNLDRQSYLDVGFAVMLLIATFGCSIALQFGRIPPIQFIDSDLRTYDDPNWRLGKMTIRNTTEAPIKLTGVGQSCGFVCGSEMPILIPRRGNIEIEVMIREPKYKLLGFAEGSIDIFFELQSKNSNNSVSGVGTSRSVLNWGLTL